jgi:hypothetical protein
VIRSDFGAVAVQQNPFSLARAFLHSRFSSLSLSRMRELGRFAFVALLLLASSEATAQAVPARVVDRHLRIETAHAGRVSGRVIRVSTDSVVLRDDRTRAMVAIAQTDVLRADVASGLPLGRSVQRGAAIGAGLGVAVMAVGVLADAKVDGESMGLSNVAIAAPVAVLLTLLGTAVGAWSSGETWTTLTPMRVGANVQAGRSMQIGVRMSF